MNLTLLVISLPAVLLLAGGVLTLTALFGRRRGETPYCRKCKYNLTGIDGDRCPECGRAIAGRNVVRGERPRRRARLAVGLACLLLAATALTGFGIATARGVDWYAHAPSALLLAAMQHAEDDIAIESLGELSGRVVLRKLNGEQVTALTELCLAEQARSQFRAGLGHLAVEVLADLLDRDLLSEQEMDAFCRNMLHDVSIHVQPYVIADRSSPVMLRSEIRAPSPPHWNSPPLAEQTWYILQHRFRTDDEPQAQPHAVAGSMSWSGTENTVYIDGAGQHEVHCDIDFSVMHGDINSVAVMNDIQSEQYRIYHERLVVTKKVTAVHDHSDVLVTPVHDPSTDRIVASAVGIKGIERLSDDSVQARFLVKGPRPVGLAFYVFADTGSQELLVDSFGVAPGAHGDPNPKWNVVSAKVPRRATGGAIAVYAVPGTRPPCEVRRVLYGFDIGSLPDRVDIILRSNEGVARSTLEVTEFWEGELRFDDVPVHDDRSQWGAVRYGRVVRD